MAIYVINGRWAKRDQALNLVREYRKQYQKLPPRFKDITGVVASCSVNLPSGEAMDLGIYLAKDIHRRLFKA